MFHRLLITLVAGVISLNSAFPQAGFIPPLKMPLFLSANFGELRPDHYHSGIDIRTQGTGREVVAADDGYVYYLLVSPVGFGRAVFIRHPSGLSTVYGHLESFAPGIEEYVKTLQYRSKSFSVTISPPQDRFPVKKGQLIGYSGNSGSSNGPHLHFEVRKSDSEKPVNPLRYQFGITDNIKPVIERLVVYPANKGTFINGRNGKLFLSVAGASGKYELGQELAIHGMAGFGITSYDFMNDTPNRFGINAIEMTIDSIPWFRYEVNEFSFSESRYINAHIDYEESVRRNIDIEKLFVLPNDRLSLYRTYMNNGLFDFSDGKSHLVTISVKDGSGNQSVLAFNVKPGIEMQDIFPVMADSLETIMPFAKDNYFESDGVKVSIPAGALYDTLHFSFRILPRDPRFYSRIYHIHNRFTPLQRQYTLSIKPDSVPSGQSSKMVLVQIDERGTVTCSGGKYTGGFVTANLYSLGTYAVGIDTVAPVIWANGLKSNPDLTGRSEIRIKIKDDFSGIRSYEGLIDNKWALFEYDAKNDVIIYKPDPVRLEKGKRHTLAVTVSDNCGNTAVFNSEFTW